MGSSRIYVYKITFKGQDFFYFGVHKEKKYDEEYWGSPVTHRHIWDSYEPQKEILECFLSWEEAKKAERALILPHFNSPLCLNENVGGTYSLDAMRKGGRISGKLCRDQKKGFFAMTQEEWSAAGGKGGKLGGKKCYEEGKGLFGRDPEQIKKDCSKAGKIGGLVGGRKSKPGPKGRDELSKAAKNTHIKYPYIAERFREAGQKARKKLVKVICLSTGKEEVFESITEACKTKTLTASAVTGVLQGKFKQHKGYFFELL
jgi:hypothetical protein